MLGQDRQADRTPERDAIRYPFVRPRIPSLTRAEHYFQQARDVGLFSNFGPVSRAFEHDLRHAFFTGSAVIACANCTAGLSAALIALKVDGPVLIPAFTFPATASAVRAAGCEVVVGDVDSHHAVLDASAIEPAVRDAGVQAVIAIRPFGHWGDLSSLADACRRAQVPLIVDNAAGLGVLPVIVRRFGLPDVIEVFSLHATKPFAVGEGGVIVAPAALEGDLRSALNFGLGQPGRCARGTGLNGKMPELTAALARTVLEDFDGRMADRRAMAAAMNRDAADDDLPTLCAPGDEMAAAWQCFPVLLPPVEDAAVVVDRCFRAGLQVRRYYHPLVIDTLDESRVPTAWERSRRTVCLPIYDGQEADQSSAIWSIFRQARAGRTTA